MTKLTVNGVNNDNQRAGIELDLSTGSNNVNAVPVVAELINLANTLGLYTPARDVFLDWAHGNDTTADSLTVAGGANVGQYIDIREHNTEHRKIVILNGSTPTYSFKVYMSRNPLFADSYEVYSSGAVTGAVETLVLTNATYGYDKYIWIEITPTATTQDFQVYLVGKGG